MTLDQIRIFLEVAEQGHMTRAARSLNLTQSAVSASVAAFEAQHQIRLFDRIGRGIVLTDEGQAFVPTARALMAQAETARLVLDDLAREPRGRLRFQASQTVASHITDIHDMTRHTDEEIRRTSLATTELQARVGQLENLVGRFKT